MACVSYLPKSILQDRLDKVYRNLYLALNPEEMAQAYGGVHPLGFAEPEFAGKYMDISASYARNFASRRALENGRAVVDGVVAGQRVDGYLGGYAPGQEYQSFSVWNQAFTCFGLISYYDASGYAPALEAAMRCMDCVVKGFRAPGAPHLLHSGNFGAQHLVILLPAAQLFARTKEARYAAFCQFILDTCRQSPTHNIFACSDAMRFGSPKGIETLAFLLGLCTYGQISGDKECEEAARAYWQDLLAHHIRLTGDGTIAEFWTYQRNNPSMLPRDILPNENCVTVGWMELSLMLYDRYLDGRYFDAVERALYNHLLGAMAPDGSDFAYYQGNYGLKSIATEPGRYRCCRFRGLSMFAHLPECAVFVQENTVALPLYASFDCDARMQGHTVRLEMRTDYPRDGEVHIRVKPERDIFMRLLLRVPAWCADFTVAMNGRALHLAQVRGHAVLEGIFPAEGMHIDLKLDMPIRRHIARVDDIDCVAIEYGPLLLALDSHYSTPIFSTTVDASAEILTSPTQRRMFPMACFETTGTVRGVTRTIRLVDYASAGMLNPRKDRFRVWLPMTGADLDAIY